MLRSTFGASGRLRGQTLELVALIYWRRIVRDSNYRRILVASLAMGSEDGHSSKDADVSRSTDPGNDLTLQASGREHDRNPPGPSATLEDRRSYGQRLISAPMM